jgi:sporulation integral membrane protein YtvI
LKGAKQNMLNRRELKRARIIKIGLVVIGIVLGIFLFYKLSFYVMPFIIAFIIASIIEPIIRFLMRKTKMPRKIAAPITLLFFLCSFGVIITLIVIRLINEIKSVAVILPDIAANLYMDITIWVNKGIDIFQWLPPEVTDNIGSVLSDFSKNLTNLLKSITKGAYVTAVSIPEALLFTIITILSTFFISNDREKISRFFTAQFPKRWIDKAKDIMNDMFSALVGYLKAQLIIMMITFAELFIGFTIIRVRYSLLLAFIISIADALPILGTGGFLVPWSIYSFFTGNIRMGVSLLILYGIVLIVRQLIEPKIVGAQIGVYPLVTLIAMYTGLKIFGFIGLILGPILVLVIRNIMIGILKNRTIKDLIEAKEKSTS